MYYNKLTAAETERLAILAEELGEAIQVIGKIIRHGYKSRNPLEEDALTNKQLLEIELGDVHHAISYLCGSNDIDAGAILERAAIKSKIIQPWLHCQNTE